MVLANLTYIKNATYMKRALQAESMGDYFLSSWWLGDVPLNSIIRPKWLCGGSYSGVSSHTCTNDKNCSCQKTRFVVNNAETLIAHGLLDKPHKFRLASLQECQLTMTGPQPTTCLPVRNATKDSEATLSRKCTCLPVRNATKDSEATLSRKCPSAKFAGFLFLEHSLWGQLPVRRAVYQVSIGLQGKRCVTSRNQGCFIRVFETFTATKKAYNTRGSHLRP